MPRPVTATPIHRDDNQNILFLSTDLWDYFSSSSLHLAFKSLPFEKWTIFPAKLASFVVPPLSVLVPASLSSISTLHLLPVSPLPLSSLILSLPEHNYSSVTPTHLESLVHPSSIVHLGDHLLLNEITAKVVLCEPVSQGIVTPHTKVVLVQHNIPSRPPSLTTPDEIGLTNFLSLNSLDETIATLPVAPLSRKIPHVLLQPPPAELDDPDRIVFANLQTLATIPCFSGDWVLLDGRLARIFAYPSLPVGVHVSPVLYYNIKFPNSATVRPVTPQVKTASEISLFRVSSPAHIDKSLEHAFVAALRSFFQSHHRILSEGDVFPVVIDHVQARAFPDAQDMFLQPATPTTVAWYKVAKMTGLDGDVDGRIDFTVTKTVQVGSVRHRLPRVGYHEYLGLLRLAIPVRGSALYDSTFGRLRDLIGSSFLHMSRKSQSILLHGPRGVGKHAVVECVSRDLGMHLLEVNCFEIIGESQVKTRAHLQVRFEWANQSAPCILLLNHVDALAKKTDTLEEIGIRTFLSECLAAKGEFPVVLVATTSDKERVADELIDCFRHELAVNAPSESERVEILAELTKSELLSPEVSLLDLAVRSAGLVAADLVEVVSRAKERSCSRVEEYGNDGLISGVLQTPNDFDEAVLQVRKNHSDSIGAPRIPNVSWADVGGLGDVKKDIMDTIQLPLERPDLFSSGTRKRSGILLYGPPGTGKTLLAKAVATNFSLNFFSVKGPELLNMYIGESEANVRRVFRRARDARPCVVFFDELDSVAPKRGNQGDSGGVMDRIVSQLLAELDGMSRSDGVFVIGATNRPDLLDGALLRPGRFDRMLYLDVCSTHEQQLRVLEALARKFTFSSDVSLKLLSEHIPLNFTGADLYALCSDAILKSMSRKAAIVDAKIAQAGISSTMEYFERFASEEDLRVCVSQGDFEEALDGVVPSVSDKELEHYRSIQHKFGQSAVGVSKGKGRANGV